MTDRPIIFSAPMVRALLDGRKTQTRRLATSPLRKCAIGDRLYVRENWRVSPEACEGWHPEEMRGWIDYQAEGSLELVAPSFEAVEKAAFLKGEERDWDFLPSRYRPCIHMPRWASRLTLIVEGVKVEPLQSISEADAEAEGILWQEPTDEDREWAKAYSEENGGDDVIRGVWIAPGTDCGFGPKPHQPLWGPTAANCYAALWGSLHTDEGQRWQDNPDVVALTFRVVRGNIDQVPA
jgi:hypothetical protein